MMLVILEIEMLGPAWPKPLGISVSVYILVVQA